jgi:hypothetical protein
MRWQLKYITFGEHGDIDLPDDCFPLRVLNIGNETVLQVLVCCLTDGAKPVQGLVIEAR